MSLQKQMASGVVWSILQQLSVQLINFIVLLILSRVLMPEAFGLFAMLQVFIAIGTALMDAGMTSSLIRKKDVTHQDYSTVFCINLLAAIVIYGIIFFVAPLISHLYTQPQLTPVLRVFAISFIIQALISVQATRLTKQMNFKLQLYFQLPASIIGALCGIWFALHGYGVWSLVYMNLIRAVVSMLQHWIFTHWRPSLQMDKKLLRYHFHFGSKITLISIINAIYNNMYDLLIGKFFSARTLGFYNQANTLSMFPVQFIASSVEKVSYPAFAKIQSDEQRLKFAYKNLLQVLCFMVSPVMMFLILTAQPVVHILLSDKWLPAVPFFQILCIYAMIYPLQTYNINILKVKGRSDLLLKIEVVKKVVGIAGTIVAIQFGIDALLWFKVAYGFFLFYMNTYYSGKMIGYSIGEQIKNLAPLYIISFVAAAACFFINSLLQVSHLNYWIWITVDAIIFAVVYFTCTAIWHKQVLTYIGTIIKNLFNKK